MRLHLLRETQPLAGRGALLLGLLAAACLLPPLRLRAADPRHTPVVDVVKRVRAAVVNIHSERTVQAPATEEMFALTPSQNRINGMGTGIIIDARGYIITNHHVVEDVNLIRVRLADGTTSSARVLARDAESDLALLKIDTNKLLPVIPFGTSSDLMVGETVVAIGNAYGYDHTVTVGVVSAIKRDVTLNKEVSYKSLIQTDASINPGNSGGPLLNIKGELIGVNVAIRAGAQGIGFAIPVDSMLRVAADMLSIRKRNSTWHGLVLHDQVQPEADGADRVGEPDGQAVRASASVASTAPRALVVERVEPGSPAAQAGIQRHDVITQVGDMAVTCQLELERALLDRPVGDRVSLALRRPRAPVATATPTADKGTDGGVERVELVLQALDRAPRAPDDLVWRKLGLHVQPVGADVVARTNQQLHGGLLVLDVNAQGVAGKAGIQRGDILVGLHQWEMLTADNVVFVLSHPDLASFNPLRFYIVRNGQVHRGWMQQVD
jgi:serine protease Do